MNMYGTPIMSLTFLSTKDNDNNGYHLLIIYEVSGTLAHALCMSFHFAFTALCEVGTIITSVV